MQNWNFYVILGAEIIRRWEHYYLPLCACDSEGTSQYILFSSSGSCICVPASVRRPIPPADTGKPLGAVAAESKLKQMVLML